MRSPSVDGGDGGVRTMFSLNLPVLTPRVVKNPGMPIYEVNPQADPRWSALVECDPRSSVFHTTEWLGALQKTYKYVPRIFTFTSPGFQLSSGLVFCEVNSWITGSRLVSLPFSDHCEPLVQDAEELRMIISGLRKQTAGDVRYLEIRPRSNDIGVQHDVWPYSSHCLSVIDLRPGIEKLYSRLHKDSVQRKIRRAEREHIVVEEGRSEALIRDFYELLVLTRRRHKLPPQPLYWFQNLVAGFGRKLTIRVARVKNKPIASILTLRHKKTLVYKYGCSDDRFHNLGSMPFLFWHAIQEAKSERLEEFDLGRSANANMGLLKFKDHLGADRTWLRYWRSSAPNFVSSAGEAAQYGIAQTVLSHLPDSMFRLAGKILYRHIG